MHNSQHFHILLFHSETFHFLTICEFHLKQQKGRSSLTSFLSMENTVILCYIIHSEGFMLAAATEKKRLQDWSSYAGKKKFIDAGSKNNIALSKTASGTLQCSVIDPFGICFTMLC